MFNSVLYYSMCNLKLLMIPVLKFRKFDFLTFGADFCLCLFIVVQVQLSPFSCLLFPPPHPPPPPAHPSPLWLCPWALYTCFLMTLPFLSPLLSSPLSSGYCQFVLYFNVSAYILLTDFFFAVF